MPLPRTGAPRRKANEVGTDDHAGILLHIPERKCAGDDIDAVVVRPFFLATGVSRDDVETIHIDVAAAHLVAGENPDTARRRHAAQLDPPEACDCGVVEDGDACRRRH